MTSVRKARERAEKAVGRASDVVADHGRVFRIVWIAVGVIVIAAGLAMIIVPGPVTVVVPAGLIMLAAVFGWARTVLVRTVEEGAKAKDRFDDLGPWPKALTFLASACAAGAVMWFLFS